ncbi:hypothetical protein SCB71_06445 [Herbiconiux sp. KACC 21604]|uniref:hypothetical protein n=1 Tax=unclassified Herbiconiux TaxID=2618217 RepID=UPI0014924713|nr:hypothetical protein [Herbiconiux sp. SALV-R1]QJU52954.1 hypothetical protein HL652_04430 [Herbiconiux sp. SALV-R1]WPO87878.1 hypothetical protein SCB71_06445 [Herbiconiux sp. KACC 21604]
MGDLLTTPGDAATVQPDALLEHARRVAALLEAQLAQIEALVSLPIAVEVSCLDRVMRIREILGVES